MTNLPRLRSSDSVPALLAAIVLVGGVLGCGSNDAPAAGSSSAPVPASAPASASALASASASASAAPVDVVVGIPVPADKVAKEVNPKGAPRYSGPVGTLRGTIRIQGDPPPDIEVTLPKGRCRAEAAATHGKLFRVGQEGALADALVTVTGYTGSYVPPRTDAVKVTISGCSLARRTVAAAYGQRIEVANLDRIESYMPYLDGAPAKAILVAVPGGEAVKLYPLLPGHYMIRDQLPNEHLTADVYVLKFATHDVTGLDGKYEISGIPVGQMAVNALLPATGKTKAERVEIKEGDNTLDLTLTYDAKMDVAQRATTGRPRLEDVTAPPAGSAAKPTGPKG